MVAVIQACRYALDPTDGQHTALRSHCGARRHAFNWGLARIKANLDQRAAEASYDVPAGQLTPPVSWSAYSLRRDWNQAKAEAAPSCRFTTGAYGVTSDRRHVKLPRIGVVRTHESTRRLARHLERGTARIRSATVSHQSGRWFCSSSVEITRPAPTSGRPVTTAGVDLGVKSLAVLSTGLVVPDPKHLGLAQPAPRRLRRQAARRVGSDRSSGQRPSNRWRRTHAKIAQRRPAQAHNRPGP
jgi:putative transposase